MAGGAPLFGCGLHRRHHAGTGLQQVVLALLLSEAILLPSDSLLVRRIHDAGRSGWWALHLIVPCVGVIAFVFGLQAGARTNQWGPAVSV